MRCPRPLAIDESSIANGRARLRPGDLPDRSGRPDEIQRAVRARLDIGDDAEVPAEEDLFTFGQEVVRRRVVGDAVLQPAIVEAQVLAS